MATTKKILVYLLFVFSVVVSFFNVFEPINFFFFQGNMYLVLTGFFFVITYLLLRGFKFSQINLNWIDFSILAYFIYNVVNIIIFDASQFSSVNFLFFAINIILYFSLKDFFVQNQKDNGSINVFFIAVVLVLNLVPIVIGIFEYTGFLEIFDSGYIMCGGLMNPGAFANYLATISPFTIAVFWFGSRSSRPIKILTGFIGVLSLFVLILLNARTAWVAVSISLFYLWGSYKISFSFTHRFLNSAIKRIICGVAFLTIVLCLSYVLFHYKKDSAEGRFFIWENCLRIIKDKPLLGNGFHSFIKTSNNYQIAYFEKNPSDIKNGMLVKDSVFALNDYLQLTTEIGIVGLFLFMSIVCFIFKKKNHEDLQRDKSLTIASKSCVLAMLLCALFSYPFNTSVNITIFYFFVAFISAGNKPILNLNFQNIKFKFLIIPTIVLLFAYVEYLEVRELYSIKKWKLACSTIGNQENIKTFDLYDQIYPQLKNNYQFLYNYGLTKLQNNQFEEAIPILESAKKGLNNYILFLNLGDCYSAVNKLDLAEKNYLNASYLIPHMFVAKQKLFKLYLQTKQIEKAYRMAVSIDKMPVKVYSPIVGKIKSEAMEYLKVNKGLP